MANADRKQAVHKEPSEKPPASRAAKILRVLSVATALIVIIPALFKAGTYIIGLHDSLSSIRRQLSAFDTVYLFKHTFDFPDPSFKFEEEELADLTPSPEGRARALICTPEEHDGGVVGEELPATHHELFEKINLYKRELAAFDNSIELKFYTMGGQKDEPVQTMIRQETACYKRTLDDDGTPRDSRITPAPIEVRMQAESAEDSDDNSGTFVKTLSSSFDHDDSDSKTFPFLGLPNHPGLQVHSLTATVVDREGPNQRFCKGYEIKAAAGELDRCDFEVFVFAYLDSPPLPPLVTNEE